MEIRINGLTKVFPPNIQALSDIYLDIAEGEFVYLIGTTGSGKTTLMRLLTREVLPTRGQVIIAGQDLRRISSSSLPYYRRNIGVVHDSATSHIRRFIMQRAQQLLMAGATISETAESLGFDYPQHFTRQFKKLFGVTPSDFIRKSF